jgi:hypothetical protein
MIESLLWNDAKKSTFDFRIRLVGVNLNMFTAAIVAILSARCMGA